MKFSVGDHELCYCMSCLNKKIPGFEKKYYALFKGLANDEEAEIECAELLNQIKQKILLPNLQAKK